MKVKIAKLLALAMDQAGRPEGERAAEQAMRLMAKFGIAEGEVRAATDENPMVRHTAPCPNAGWRIITLNSASALAGVFSCSGKGEAWLMGRRTDVELAAYLFKSLTNQCQAAARNHKRKNPEVGRKELRIFRDSWVSSMSEKVEKVLRAQHHAAAALNTEALAPLGRQESAIRWAKQHVGPFTSRGINMRPWSQEGLSQGARANLQTGIGGTAARRLKG